MGQFPFDAQNEGALIRKILKGAYAPITGPYTATLVGEYRLMRLLKLELVKHPACSDTLIDLCFRFSLCTRCLRLALRKGLILPCFYGMLMLSAKWVEFHVCIQSCSHDLTIEFLTISVSLTDVQARALGVDLNPRPVGSTEDIPTYEAEASPVRQQQQIPEARPNAASYMNYPPYNMGSPMSPQHPFAQQQQQAQRPLSAQAAGRPAVRPTSHPFEAPPQYQKQQGQQRARPAGGPLDHPFALDPANENPWDRMADDIQRMQIGTVQFNQ